MIGRCDQWKIGCKENPTATFTGDSTGRLQSPSTHISPAVPIRSPIILCFSHTQSCIHDFMWLSGVILQSYPELHSDLLVMLAGHCIFSAAVHCGRWGFFCIRLHNYMCYSWQNAALDVTRVCDLMLLHIGDAPDLHSPSSRFRLMIECVAFSPQRMEISLLSDEVFTSFN